MMIVFMGAMAYLIYQVKNPQRSESEQIGFMLLISFLMGFVTGPGINMIAEVAP